MELSPLEFSRLRDLNHDARVDLVDERDTSSPDPVHIRELALDIHGGCNKYDVRCEKRRLEEQEMDSL